MLSEQEQSDLRKMFGDNYDETDIPAIWRDRELQKQKDKGLLTDDEFSRLKSEQTHCSKCGAKIVGDTGLCSNCI